MPNLPIIKITLYIYYSKLLTTWETVTLIRIIVDHWYLINILNKSGPCLSVRQRWQLQRPSEEPYRLSTEVTLKWTSCGTVWSCFKEIKVDKLRRFIPFISEILKHKYEEIFLAGFCLLFVLLRIDFSNIINAYIIKLVGSSSQEHHLNTIKFNESQHWNYQTAVGEG